MINLKSFYSISLFLMICAAYSLSFTWSIHIAVFEALATFASVVYYNTRPHVFNRNKSGYIIFSVLLLWYLYSSFLSPNIIGQLILNVMLASCLYTLVFLSNSEKKRVFFFISRATSLILLISLIGWLLYLVGVPLSNRLVDDYRDGFHHYVDFYIFLLPQKEYLEYIPRFCSVFIEPGQMASVCVLLLLSNLLLKGRKFDIIIFSVAIFFSFSLAGWLVLLFALIVNYLLFKLKNPIMFFLNVCIIALTMAVTVSNIGNNSAISHYIIERMSYDEDLYITGNNRTNEFFDKKYHDFITSSDAIWGIHNQLIGDKNWTRGNSGYKVFIVVNGLFGFFCVLLLFLTLFKLFPSREARLIICSWFVFGMIRSFWTNPYWLIILLLSGFLLQQSKEKKYVE